MTFATAIAGCAARDKHEKIELSTKEGAADASAESNGANPAPGSQSDSGWQKLQAALRGQRLRLDRVDESSGVITTVPEVSQHWFEFWRKDVATFRDFLESSMNCIRRWVEVTAARGNDGSWDHFSVIVHMERLSAPDRQFKNSACVYQFFADSLPSTTGAPKVTQQDHRWIDMGRDSAMEEYLGHKIAARTGLSVASAQEP